MPPHQNNQIYRHEQYSHAVHTGEADIHLPPHGFVCFMMKYALIFNLTSLVLLWVLFNWVSAFSGVEQNFISPLNWFFFFGLVYTAFAGLFFKTARMIEIPLYKQIYSANRQYRWHSQYDTKNMSEAELKKVPKTKEKPLNHHDRDSFPEVIFRISGWMAFAAIISACMGVYMMVNTLF